MREAELHPVSPPRRKKTEALGLQSLQSCVFQCTSTDVGVNRGLDRGANSSAVLAYRLPASGSQRASRQMHGGGSLQQSFKGQLVL